MVDLTNREDEKRGVFEELITREGIVAYCEELIDQVLKARNLTRELEQQVSALVMGRSNWIGGNATYVDMMRGLRRSQDKARDNLMMRYGRVVGTLATLMHCRLIAVEDYNALVQKAHGAVLPTVVVQSLEIIGAGDGG